MRWFEIRIYTTEEATEAIADFLHGLGAGGVSIEESGTLDRQRDTSLGQWYELPLNDIPEGEAEIKAYFAEGHDMQAITSQLQGFVGSLSEFGLDTGKAEISSREVDDADWANEWKQYYKPVRISPRLTIKPTWEPYDAQDGELIIELDPGMAFGTGTHPTTALCLRTIEQYVRQDDYVIDVGTGSGILAIAAAKLGAKHVLALDLDPVAVSSATENFRLNQLDNVTAQHSDLLGIIQDSEAGELGVRLPVQLVIANILAEIIITFIEDVHRILIPGGLFIASGIITAKEQLVISSLEKAGFTIIACHREEDWVAVVARK